MAWLLAAAGAQPCPGNATRDAAAGGACACLAGYSGPAAGPCEPCAAGLYKAGPGAGGCTPCPAHAATAAPASPSLQHCLCDAGFAGDFPGAGGGDTCAACARGTYKAAAGAPACAACRGELLRGMALMLQSPPRLASLASRKAPPRRNASDATVPTYDAAARVVEFDRTHGQHLDGGAHTLNIDSNGGFTLVVVVQFTGHNGFNEHVLALGSSIVLSRYDTDDSLQFVVAEPGHSDMECTLWSASGSIVQGQWVRIAASYTRSADGSSGNIRLQVGASVHTRACAPARSDRRENSSEMGQSIAVGAERENGWVQMNEFFNGRVAGLLVVDAVLPADVVAELLEGMASGEGADPLAACAVCEASDACAPACAPAAGAAGACACVPGHTPSPAAGPRVCEPCAAGSAKPAGGNETCAPCSNGTHAPAAGSAACAANPAGSTSSLDGTAFVCAAGTRHAGAGCALCAPGTHQPRAGAAACAACAPGTWLAAPDAAAAAGNCTLCAAGKYSPHARAAHADACQDCEAGTYLPAAGSAAQADCVACAPGKYSAAAGSAAQADCAACAPGKYSAAAGAAAEDSCRPCPAGSHGSAAA